MSPFAPDIFRSGYDVLRKLSLDTETPLLYIGPHCFGRYGGNIQWVGPLSSAVSSAPSAADALDRIGATLSHVEYQGSAAHKGTCVCLGTCSMMEKNSVASANRGRTSSERVPRETNP